MSALISMALESKNFNPNLVTKAQIGEAMKKASKQYITIVFLTGAAMYRYGKRIGALQNDYMQGHG
jgi:hypothetical protein